MLFNITMYLGNSLVVQWLGLHAFTAEGVGLIPGWGTKIPQAAWCGQRKKKKKKYIYAYTHIYMYIYIHNHVSYSFHKNNIANWEHIYAQGYNIYCIETGTKSNGDLSPI